MSKAIKYALWTLAGLVLLAIAGAVILAATFNPNRYKPEIERMAKEQTGRTLKLAGDLELAFYPSLGAKVAGVTLSERASDQIFLALDSAHVAVKLLPLLRGEVIVDALRVSGLKAQVVKGKDGKFNFDDLLEAEGKDAKKPAAKDETRKDSGGAPLAFDISGVKIERSSLTYRDLAAGSEMVLSDLHLSTGRVAPQAQGKLELGGALKGAKPRIDAKLDLKTDYELDLPKKAVALQKLAIDLAAASPDLPMKSVKLAITGGVQANLDKQTMNADLVTKFDESTIQAKLGLAKFSPPSYVFDINIDRLNVDKYFPVEKKPAGEKDKAAGAGKSAPAAAAETPVDLSALEGLDARGKLHVGALQVRNLKLADVRSEVRAAGGRMDIAPHSANLYEGSVSGALTLQASGNRVALKETLTGIAIGPLLRDVAEMDRLEGKGQVALDVTASGKTVEAMKKALAGTARLDLKDGAIKGIDIAAAMRKAKAAFSGGQSAQAAATTEKTDFSELSASFTIKNGVAHNEDLSMKSPLVRLGGRGDIDVGNSRLDYTAKATVVGTTEGQGGKDVSQLSGLTVPVRLTTAAWRRTWRSRKSASV
jgi:AsmA protein